MTDGANKDNFFYPRARYRGKFTVENLAFNANLQEFSQKASFIAGLHANGKLTSQEAYEKLEQLWEQLEISKNVMHIGRANQE